ncbi:MAG: nucleotidyltransferase [Clostridiaceae bacterium]
MKIVGIISEYNPFHKGHAYQIEKTKEDTGATHVVALMSGNFVQRGMPSIIDKYERAEMALLGGADLVLELPSVYALSSAEFFAEGGVRILDALKGIDILSFGSEEGELKDLYTLADFLTKEPAAYQDFLRKELDSGKSYATARNIALKKFLPEVDETIIQSPNNILGIEYLKALIRLDSKIEPYTLKRKGKGYHDLTLTESHFASATALRKGIMEEESIEEYIPKAIFSYLTHLKDEHYSFTIPEDFKDLLLYRLMTDGAKLNTLPEASEGLDNRVMNHLHLLRERSLEEFIDTIKTKRYARTRISRLLFQFLLSFDMEDIETLRRQTPPSVKILAVNDKGREILKSLRKDKEIKIIHNFEKRLDPFQSIDQKASGIYALKNNSYDATRDFTGNKK